LWPICGNTVVEDPLVCLLRSPSWIRIPTGGHRRACLQHAQGSEQEQVGLIYERTLLTDLNLTATVYGGHRSTIQFQAIPMASEANALSPGGVIDLGAALRHGCTRERHAPVFSTPLLLTAA